MDGYIFASSSEALEGLVWRPSTQPFQQPRRNWLKLLQASVGILRGSSSACAVSARFWFVAAKVGRVIRIDGDLHVLFNSDFRLCERKS